MSKKKTPVVIQSQNLDANESVFFARELEHIKATVVETAYQELMARQLIPVSMEADPADETITYRMMDRTGVAKVVTDYAKDFPRVDLLGQEFTGKIRSLGSAYGYNIQEVRAAAKTGKPLSARLAMAAKEAILTAEDKLALFGDVKYGLQGFLNHPNLPEQVIPADGTGASKTWTTKSVDQVLRDLNLAVNTIVANTLGVEKPDTVLLPISQYTDIATRRVGTDSNMTILRFFLETNPFIKSVVMLPDLDGAGAGGTDRMIVYRRDPSKLTLEIPQDFEQFPPQEEGLEFIIHCHSRCGGVLFYKPMSACYADGI